MFTRLDILVLRQTGRTIFVSILEKYMYVCNQSGDDDDA
jgi:hypothetical protein